MLTSPWQVADTQKAAMAALLEEFREVFEAEGLLGCTSIDVDDLRVGADAGGARGGACGGVRGCRLEPCTMAWVMSAASL